jgi:glycosyltransferase involved in cell wall biosynthesis
MLQSPALLVPAHNEAGTVHTVVANALRLYPYPVYVIDDASADGTAEQARAAGARVIPLAAQLGAWGATQAGIRYAIERGHDAVVTLDADGQHDPAYVDALLAPLRAGAADVCIGAWTERGSTLRRIAWHLLRLSSGIDLNDLTSGFRAYNAAAMQLLSGWRATYLDYQDVGVLALMLRHGMTVVDIPTRMAERGAGASRVFASWLIVVRYMIHTMTLGLSKRRIPRLGKATREETPS